MQKFGLVVSTLVTLTPFYSVARAAIEKKSLSASTTFLVSPSNSSDAIGSYRLDNVHQCERLCWYWSACTTYSYRPVTTSPVWEKNCVLHSAYVEVSSDTQNITQSTRRLYSKGWNLKRSPLPPRNGCFSRPCSRSHFCVPLPRITPPQSNFRCLTANVTCSGHVTGMVAYGDVTPEGTRQGDKASVKCLDGFALIPRNSLSRLTCQANSRWSPFRERCIQYLWGQQSLSNATSGFKADFPWTIRVEEGWGMCVKGKMVATDRMYVNFFFQPPNSSYSDVPLHLDFSYAKGLVYDKVVNAKWQNAITLGTMPLQLNQDYQLSFQLASTQLNISVVGKASYRYQIPLDSGTGSDSGVTLEKVRSLWMGEKLELHYVNLISKCGDVTP